MNGEAELVSLAEVAEITSGGTPSKARKDFWIGNIPWVSAKDLKVAQLEDSEDHISEDGLKNGSRLAYKGSTLILARGMTLISDVPTCFVSRDLAFNQDLKAIKAKDGVDETYLYYSILAAKPILLAAVELAGHGTGRLPTDRIKSLPIRLPSIKEQQVIANIFKSIDDKIALNRQTNQTLEAIAQALFKSWFVDFEPVRAKIAALETGEDPTLAAMRTISGKTDDELAHWQTTDPDAYNQLYATASLFPEAVVESESGLVPEGWKVDDVYKIAKVIYGAPFKSSLFNSDKKGIPIIRIRDLKDENPSVYTEEINPKGLLVQPGELLVGMDGEFRTYIWGGADSWLNQRVCCFKPLLGFSTAFVRLSLDPHLAHIESTETATTVIHLGKSDIDRFRIVIPNDGLLSRFTSLTHTLYERVVSLKIENRTLADLRDTLLPKLLSGELSVSEVVAAKSQLELFA